MPYKARYQIRKVIPPGDRKSARKCILGGQKSILIFLSPPASLFTPGKGVAGGGGRKKGKKWLALPPKMPYKARYQIRKVIPPGDRKSARKCILGGQKSILIFLSPPASLFTPGKGVAGGGGRKKGKKWLALPPKMPYKARYQIRKVIPPGDRKSARKCILGGQKSILIFLSPPASLFTPGKGVAGGGGRKK